MKLDAIRPTDIVVSWENIDESRLSDLERVIIFFLIGKLSQEVRYCECRKVEIIGPHPFKGDKDFIFVKFHNTREQLINYYMETTIRDLFGIYENSAVMVDNVCVLPLQRRNMKVRSQTIDVFK